MAHQCQRPMCAIYRKLFVVSLTLLSTPPPQFVRCCINMVADWKEDNDLNLDLEDYVRQNLKKLEILDFLKEKYAMYTWSYRSLGKDELFQHKIHQ